MEDKRRTERIKKSLVVRYAYNNDRGDKVWDTSIVRDISEGGMSITTHLDFPVHKILTLLIKIPSRPFEEIELQGRVCGSREHLSGIYITHIEFVGLKDEQKKLIREYVDWVLKKRG
jgi:hypothetical protein